MRIYSWGATDVGMRRDHNEDSFLLAPELNLFVVADGMGGHAGGEMASGISVRTIEKVVRARREILDPGMHYDTAIEQNPVAHLLSDAVRAAGNAVFLKAQSVRELHGMGTTTTALMFHDEHAFVAHVGDSRAYLIRDGRILQLSEDHSLVNEQMRAGLITAEQARKSRFKNVITRSVGFDADVDVDVIAVAMKPTDVFVVCCDGLSNLVSDVEIARCVGDSFLHHVPELLIETANSRGGDDNITVVTCVVVDEEDVTWGDDAAVFVDPLIAGDT